MKTAWKFFLVAILAAGCARVQVEAPKDPIKMDITMRLDVYQHVVSDINDIESIVSGKAPAKPADVLAAAFGVGTAYAAEGGLAPEVEAAAYSRRDRRAAVMGLLGSGAVGENNAGLLEVRGGGSDAASVTAAENADRLVIYRSIASKNGTSVEEVQKIYAERLRSEAPSGSPVQDPAGRWGSK